MAIMVILLMTINSYSTNGYWWLFQVKLSQAINGYFINHYSISGY